MHDSGRIILTVGQTSFGHRDDLLSGMVGEFPDLQGTMGQHYATSDGEPPAVAAAIGEHYRPRFAGDALPETAEGRILAVADRMDTLAGIFALGKKPSGNRDPFGLRRAALGIIRILIECGLDLDLKALIATAVELQPATRNGTNMQDDLYVFITERLRRYFLDRDPGLDTETFDAVMARQPSSLVDFEPRNSLLAVDARSPLLVNGSRKSGGNRTSRRLRYSFQC